MAEADLKHRLAAILAADAAGYSRLMAADERRTVAALDSARAVFRKYIESNQGRVVDTAGDSVLAVFDTATGATSAALAIQAELASSAQDISADRRLLFRIGLHLGDVIEKPDGTIYGDGVNIAARLQALADAGGTILSDSVRNAVRGKVGASFDDLGEQAVKNIAEPVRAYRLRMAAGLESSKATPSKQVPSSLEIDLSLPDKPSIAVLPFTNMSGDPEQEYFTDGVTEDIITELSRFHSLFVIARNSSFTYKGKAVDVRTVGKELGVRYVLEGSIRRSANRVRVTGQLIDALNGKHIWAEKFDRVLEDIFAVQEEVTQSIVAAIAPQIEMSEILRARSVRPGNLSAYELAMRASAAASVAMIESDSSFRDEAVRLAREALAIDPDCGAALRTIVYSQWQNIYFNTTASAAAASRDGIDAATRAIAVDSGDHVAHLWKGYLLLISGHKDAGLATVRRAHELNPNDSMTLACLGFCEAMADDPQRGLECSERALRLSPRDPSRYLFINVRGWAHFALCEYTEAVECALRSVSGAPKMPAPRLCLVVSFVGMGEIARASSEFEVLRTLAPTLVDARLAGHWSTTSNPELLRRGTTFLRIAAGLEDPGAADALR